MALYGCIKNGVVIVQSEASYDATHESVQDLWQVVPDGTVSGSTPNGDGTFTPPAAEPLVALPLQFYLAFTPTERIDIKASTDPIVMEFWDTYSRAQDTNTPIDMGLISITEGLAYFSTHNVAGKGAPYIAPARIAQILALTPQ